MRNRPRFVSEAIRGDEALLCLEMFWRNERWELLFPHAKVTSVANN